MTGKDLTEALRALTEGNSESGKPEPMKTRGAASKVRSAALLAGAGGVTTGIASPLTEGNFALREFWPGAYTTTDGLFVLPAIKKLVTADANGAEVVINFAEPT